MIIGENSSQVSAYQQWSDSVQIKVLCFSAAGMVVRCLSSWWFKWSQGESLVELWSHYTIAFGFLGENLGHNRVGDDGVLGSWFLLKPSS
jgi:hypothetical protein